MIPVRAWCDIHEADRQQHCHRCRTALELSRWWAHQQGRCNPATCMHCFLKAGLA